MFKKLLPVFVLSLALMSLFLLLPTPGNAQTATPTATATATITPTVTATPGPALSGSVYTHTLSSGNVLVIEARTTSGEIITGGLMIILSAIMLFDLSVRIAYRR